jgi:ribosomal protein L37E
MFKATQHQLHKCNNCGDHSWHPVRELIEKAEGKLVGAVVTAAVKAVAKESPELVIFFGLALLFFGHMHDISNKPKCQGCGNVLEELQTFSDFVATK